MPDMIAISIGAMLFQAALAANMQWLGACTPLKDMLATVGKSRGASRLTISQCPCVLCLQLVKLFT